MKPGVSRLSTVKSPGGNSKSRFKSFKRSLLSFVRSPAPKEKTERRSFPTPSTTRTNWECSSPSETPNSISTRKAHTVRPSSHLPPPPLFDPSVSSTTIDASSEPTLTSQQQQQQQQQQPKRKQRVFKDGKLLYEWEQNSTHVTMRLPAGWTLGAQNDNVKVLIAPSFLQVGRIHKHHNNSQKARIEWKLHHTTGGTIHVEGSTWTTPEEHQIPDQGTIITLCKAKAGVNWGYALLHHAREEVQTKLCRPPRTKQRRPKTQQQQQESKPATVEQVRPSVTENDDEEPIKSPGLKKKKKKRVAKKKKATKISSADLEKPEEPQEESSYFQEKQKSTRRSGGEYSFKTKPQAKERKSSTSTHSTKPLFGDDASGLSYPVSPTTKRSGGAYSMKPSSYNRLNIYGDEKAEQPASAKSMMTDYSESSISLDYPVSPTTRRSNNKESIHSQNALDESRPSSCCYSLTRESSTFSILESPKRFSKPTSRISMEIKSPTNKSGSSSRSIDKSSSSTRSLSNGNKPASRISQQLKKRISSPKKKKILVPSKASKMDQRESLLSKSNNKRKSSNSESLDFVGHSSEVDKAFPHKPYPNGQRTSVSSCQQQQDPEMDQAQHHCKHNPRRKSALTKFLEKPSTHSHNTGNGSNFKSVMTANTNTAVVVQNMLQGWTTSGREEASKANDIKKDIAPKDESFSDGFFKNHQDAEEWNDDDFLQELEMSYSRTVSML
ncbi:unnamed protein product [Cylindrotheca closterium]|uniref:CS domain-containing protein n=1 Tax=Cylindrotheca closterium TaxID=2856 RepID=A0AAD2FTB9_9STRA|nr:unnamed protein product [Cylindrotheca closterium]